MLLIIVWIVLLSWILFLNFHPVFGWKASWLDSSNNFNNWKFENIDKKVWVWTWDKWLFWMIAEYRNASKQRFPEMKLPSDKFDKANFKSGDFVWFGHSTILMNIDDKNIITDPVFYKASPIFIWWTTFPYVNPPETNDLPDIDYVLISHDHYDHLDYKTIIEIDYKVSNYLVPLWVKAHLEKWWVNSDKIKEYDWYDDKKIDGIDFSFVPSQHFSWRWLLNRFSTLWWSWVIKWKDTNIYFSGDTWYFDEFKKIWELYGPFDIAFIENWAYNEMWMDIHMLPEQTVQTWIDLKAKKVMPIHWWKFDLSLHSWYEPIERFSLEAEKKWLWYFHPKVWETFDKQNLPKQNWWKDLITK